MSVLPFMPLIIGLILVLSNSLIVDLVNVSAVDNALYTKVLQ